MKEQRHAPPREFARELIDEIQLERQRMIRLEAVLSDDGRVVGAHVTRVWTDATGARREFSISIAPRFLRRVIEGLERIEQKGANGR